MARYASRTHRELHTDSPCPDHSRLSGRSDKLCAAGFRKNKALSDRCWRHNVHDRPRILLRPEGRRTSRVCLLGLFCCSHSGPYGKDVHHKEHDIPILYEIRNGSTAADLEGRMHFHMDPAIALFQDAGGTGCTVHHRFHFNGFGSGIRLLHGTEEKRAGPVE